MLLIALESLSFPSFLGFRWARIWRKDTPGYTAKALYQQLSYGSYLCLAWHNVVAVIAWVMTNISPFKLWSHPLSLPLLYSLIHSNILKTEYRSCQASFFHCIFLSKKDVMIHVKFKPKIQEKLLSRTEYIDKKRYQGYRWDRIYKILGKGFRKKWGNEFPMIKSNLLSWYFQISNSKFLY